MELKFRSYNKLTNTMLPNNTMEAICINSERLTLEEFEALELMRFTGFKDCNGVEIYEGDTLIDVDVTLEENVELEDTKQQVYWCSKLGCWKLDNTFSQDKSSGYLLANDLKDFRFKVVGNVYENALP